MKNILVIDDDYIYRTSLRELLKTNDYSVKTAENGQKGLLFAEQEHPDLILCDVQMPGMNGHEVLAALRGNSSLYNTPFIFLTSMTDLSDLREGMNLGADDYITKPCSADNLFQAIETRFKKLEDSKKEWNEKLNIAKKAEDSLTSGTLSVPLKSVIDKSEFLLNHFESYSKKDIMTYVTEIRDSANIINRKVRNLLLYQSFLNEKNDNSVVKQLGYGKSHIKKSLFQEVIYQTARHHGREKDVFITHFEDSILQIPLQSLRIVLEEVLDNAFKFSHKGRLVRISGNRVDDNYILEVVNQPNEKPMQISGSNSRSKSTDGMGLYIVEKILSFYKCSLKHTIEKQNIKTTINFC